MDRRDLSDIECVDRVNSYLELFNSLDLHNKVHRRTAVWLLDELYRRTLSDVGREYLEFSSGNRKRNVKQLWQKTLDRFELLEGFDEPDEYSNNIEKLHHFRNNTAHNTDFDPPKSHLENIGGNTEEWLDWLLSQSAQYTSDHEQISPRELMISMAKRSLDKILTEIDNIEMTEEFDNSIVGIQNDAEEVYEDIEHLEENEDEISVELIDALVRAVELARDLEQLQRTEAEFWSHINNRIDERRLNRDSGN